MTLKINRVSFTKFSFYLKLFLFLFTNSIFGLEIVLENGDGFLCDLISETDKSYKILYKDREFIIPKTEVRTVDTLKKGKHSSFRYSNFILKDGSKIYGVIAEEQNTSYTIKTELGFLLVEKSRIKEFPEKKPLPEMSSSYFASSVKLPETRLAIFGSGYVPSVPLIDTNKSFTGGGFYVEPAFMTWKFFRFGFRSEYLYSSSKAKFLQSPNQISLFSNVAYIQFGKTFFEKNWLEFEFNLGAGATSSTYKKSNEVFVGVNPVLFAEIAWIPLKLGPTFFKLGFSGYTIFESERNYALVGGNLSFGVRF